MRQRQGFVLITVLLVLMVLSILAFGLVFVSRGELSLLKVSNGKLRASAASRSGILYAKQKLINDPASVDTLGQIGINVDDKKPLLFENVSVGQGASFSLKFPSKNFVSEKTAKEFLGISDERGRFNLNALVSPDGLPALVFEDLVNLLRPGEGEKIRNAVLAFRGAAKNNVDVRVFFFSQELLLVEGIDEKFFKQLKDFVTVYPYGKFAEFKVNLYTAPALMVRAVFSGAQRMGTAVTSADAEAFIKCRENAIASRTLPTEKCPLSPYLSIFDLGPFSSGYYRIRSVGLDQSSGMRVTTTAVVSTENEFRILSWYRE